jgi:hypothetical protein
MVFTRSQLTSLSTHFLLAVGISADTLSCRILGENNRKAIGRLLKNRGVNAETAEKISAYYIEHWPPGILWPDDVPRLRRPRRSRPANHEEAGE